MGIAAPALCLKSLRVYVIEPQPLLGKMLCRTFSDEEQVSVVGESRHFDLAPIARARPDVIVADWENDENAMSEMIRRCRSALPNVRICVLSSHLSAPLMMRAIAAGVDGYVVKDVTPADLISCIKRIRIDGFYADPRLAGILLRERARGEGVRLTRRELDVVKLVAEGFSNKQIASRLLVSDKTIKNHVANIFAKLDVCARTQIAVYAIRNGIV